MGDSADDTAGQIVEKLDQMALREMPSRLPSVMTDWLRGEIAKALREAEAEGRTEGQIDVS